MDQEGVGFPSGFVSKECLQCGRSGFDPCSGKISTQRQPTPVFLPGESHGQRRLVGTVPGVTKSLTSFLSLGRGRANPTIQYLTLHLIPVFRQMDLLTFWSFYVTVSGFQKSGCSEGRWVWIDHIGQIEDEGPGAI